MVLDDASPAEPPGCSPGTCSPVPTWCTATPTPPVARPFWRARDGGCDRLRRRRLHRRAGTTPRCPRGQPLREDSVATARRRFRVESTTEPPVLINAFEVAEGREDDFIRGWETTRGYLQTQPGYVDTRFTRPSRQTPSFASSTLGAGRIRKRSSMPFKARAFAKHHRRWLTFARIPRSTKSYEHKLPTSKRRSRAPRNIFIARGWAKPMRCSGGHLNLRPGRLPTEDRGSRLSCVVVAADVSGMGLL
jgi:hypothetical protein